MTPELWPLIGVVLGALVGGGTQLLVDRLSHRRNRRDRLSEKRETAYVDLITASDGFRNMLSDLAEMRSTQNMNPFEGADLAAEIGDSLALRLDDLQRCLQRVRMYGTKEAWQSVRGMLIAIRSTVMLMQEGEPLSDDQLIETALRIDAQQRELMRLARSEVGADD